jgi:hypothetical protein
MDTQTKLKEASIDIKGVIPHNEIEIFGRVVYENQMSTQSKVTSIYGSNLRGVHPELDTLDVDTIDVSDIFGLQVVIPSGKKKLIFNGEDIGSLVIANVNRDPPSRKNKEWNEDGFKFDTTSVEHFDTNSNPGLILDFNCKVRHLTITNCSNMKVYIRGRIRTSIEVCNCTNMSVRVESFYMFRLSSCSNVKIAGLAAKSGIFDIRNSVWCKWYNIDIPGNEHTSGRFKYAMSRCGKKYLETIPREEDIFAIRGSHSLPPTTHIGCWFK